MIERIVIYAQNIVLEEKISFSAIHRSRQIILLDEVMRFDTIKHNVSPEGFGYDKNLNFYR